MKYAKSTMFYLIASLFAVLAVAFAPMASAADLLLSFNATTTNGTQVAITPARLASFECSGGQVTTTRVDSGTFYYNDASGALCTKLQAMPDFASKWVKQPGVNRWFQAIYDSTQCYSGSTLINYNTGLTIAGDGCQLDSLIKAKSN